MILLIVKTIHCALTPDITANVFKQYAAPSPPVLTVTCSFHTIPHFPAPTMKPLMFQEHALYRVSQEKCAKLQESVPYVKLYRYNPKHLYPKLNGYRDNGQISMKL